MWLLTGNRAVRSRHDGISGYPGLRPDAGRPRAVDAAGHARGLPAGDERRIGGPTVGGQALRAPRRIHRDGRLGLPACAGTPGIGHEVLAPPRRVQHPAGPARADEFRVRGGAARRRARGGSGHRVAGPRTHRTGVQGAAAPPSRASHVGALRRAPVAVARCLAARRPAVAFGTGDGLRSGWGLGAR